MAESIKKKKLFYRNITRRGNGYQIRYDGEHYGWYPDLPTALYDRDRLEHCDWNMSVFVELPEVPNPYEWMELPPFDERKATYIQHLPEKWRVQKRINGELCYFGTFDNEEDAIKHRDRLIERRII